MSTSPGLPPIVERLEKGQKTPICVIVVGMAGSGKSSLMAQMQYHAANKAKPTTTTKQDKADGEGEPKADEDGETAIDQQQQQQENVAAASTVPTYCINLDPATHHLAYGAAIDIRDTINYKEVMRQHKLGPNGAILTSLNLLTTKFDQIMAILEQRAYGQSEKKEPDDEEETNETEKGEETTEEENDEDDNIAAIGMDYILVDTPGQIEAFTWSASGTIVSESLASAFPTVLCFVVDTARCASSPNTFMSNMLYACSMFYRTRLPLVIVFNKNDVVPHDFCMEWMKDYEAFQEALDESMDSNTNNSATMTSTGFYGSLTRSLSLVLDEFYSNFAHCCGVSAITGDGMDDFWKCIDKAAREDFVLDYVEDLKNRLEEQQAKQQAIQRVAMKRLQRDAAQGQR
ncbi:loop GTPase 1 [Seminavis robusta]|uniref:GPN-loop GTPase n=1 Tax=Seminavis robusta TaxID=568900 RepID=A0A9N8DSG3_9STRA|nr:loop GTPase 1 [Seminavis robusta]|eukprot:Sro323_g117310.1 loop GTPase 1 (402) ;mRNA; r:29765-30970